MADSNPAATAEHAVRRAAIDANPLVLELEPEVFVASHRIVVRTPVSDDVGILLRGSGYSPLIELGRMTAERKAALAGLQSELGLEFLEGEPGSAARIVELIRELGASADFVPYVTLAPHDMGPWGPPAQIPTLDRNRTPRADGEHDVVIAILDTGLPVARSAWYANSVVTDIVEAEPVPVPDPLYENLAGVVIPGNLDEAGAAGHGLFVAALASALTSTAVEIRSYRTSEHIYSGALATNVPLGTLVSTVEICADMKAAVAATGGPLIFNLSFGGYFTNVVDIDYLKQTIVSISKSPRRIVFCAAAGNKANPDPPPDYNDGLTEVYPAAYARILPNVVISVGATDANGAIAQFSGRGPWVKAWARGVDVTAEYVEGEWTNATLVPPATFDPAHRAARWSGTSFATPAVAAALATACAVTGKTPRQAWIDMRAALKAAPGQSIQAGVIVP